MLNAYARRTSQTFGFISILLVAELLCADITGLLLGRSFSQDPVPILHLFFLIGIFWSTVEWIRFRSRVRIVAPLIFLILLTTHTLTIVGATIWVLARGGVFPLFMLPVGLVCIPVVVGTGVLWNYWILAVRTGQRVGFEGAGRATGQ